MMRLASILLAVLWFCAQPLLAQEQVTESPAQQTAPVTADATAAQDAADPQALWDAFATRVEGALQTGRASTQTLDALRAELVEWRDQFQAQQAQNAERIKTVQAQIDALGPVPSDGASEAEVIANLRTSLNTQLEDLQAPVLLARESYAQSDGFIREIDAIISDRQATGLIQRTQSPINPAGWEQTISSVLNGFRAMRVEISTNYQNANIRDALVKSMPRIILFFAVAILLIGWGRKWATGFDGLVDSKTRRGRGVWLFILSLAQVGLPFIGILLLSEAIQSTDLLGRRGSALVGALPLVGLYPLLAHWLSGGLLIPTMTDREPAIQLEDGARHKVHRRFVLLGYVMGATVLAQRFTTATAMEPVPATVIAFVFGLLIAFLLFQLGRLVSHSLQNADDSQPSGFRAVTQRLIGRLLMAISGIGAVGLAAGYTGALNWLLIPAALTLYLLAFVVILQRLSVDIYTLLSGIEDGAQDALFPALIGFALTILALPVLALIWGVRLAELSELWTRFQEGFILGGTRISPSNFVTFAMVFAIGYTLTRLLQGALRSTILPRTRLDQGGQTALVAGVGYVGIFLAAIIAITTAGIDLSGLAIVAGALSVGIGFGLQNIVSNFVSGIILLIERPISQGDWIEVNGMMGYVRKISVRSTRIETFDRTDVIIPNADLVSGTVINWTRGNSVGRVIVPVGVAYGSDTQRISEILLEIAKAHPMVLLNPEPTVVFQGFGADSLDFEIRAILRDVNWMLSVKSEMNHEIAKRFAEEGIEIPFAQRDIWLRNPEVLKNNGEETA